MMHRPAVGFALLLSATACATAPVSTRPNLEPRNGPKAVAYVRYTGGLTDRTVRTAFKTDKDAHVIVGRLGGDGRVEILYPATPSSPTLVRGGKYYDAAPFESSYDGVPRLFNYATRLQRSYGARYSSYDGRGNGFVFVIATQYPMFTDALDDHGQWSDSLEADGYWSMYDPRGAVKDFADVLTRGMPYTIEYGNAFTTMSFAGAADAAIDCANMVSAFGYNGLAFELRDMAMAFPFMGGFGSFGVSGVGLFSQPSPYTGCGFGQDRALAGFYGFGRGYTTGFVNGGNMWWVLQHGTAGVEYGPRTWYIPRNTPNTPTPGQAAKHAFSTSSRRAGFRNGDESGAAFNITRQRLGGERNASSASHSWAPPIKETQAQMNRYDRTDRANSGHRNAFGSGSAGVERNNGMATTATPVSAPVQRVAPAPPPQPAPAEAHRQPMATSRPDKP